MAYDLITPSIARLWRFPPDWRSGFSVTREFLTDIITSRSNREQRRALRDVPRVSVELNAVVTDADHRAAMQFVRGSQNRPVAVPDFSRYTSTAAIAGVGTDELEIPSPPAWIAAGQIIVLCGAAGLEHVVVESVAGDVVTLTGPLDTTWPAGAIVRPGFFGLMSSPTAQRRFKPTASEFAFRLDCYPGAEPPEDEGTTVDTFNGLEVLTEDPDWKGQPTIDHIFPVEQVDYNFGRTAQFRPIPIAQELEEAEFTGLPTARAVALEQFFLRAKGRRGTFYRSTCRPDLVLRANVTGSTIVVQGGDVAADYAAVDYASRSQAIEILQTNGTRIRRLVTDINAFGADTSLTLSSSVSLTVSTTARISWLPKARFAADALTTRWLTPSIASIAASFQTVDE